MNTKEIQLNPSKTMPRLADDLHDKASDMLINCAGETGIRIVDTSVRVCVSRNIRLATAVAMDFADANAVTPQVDPVLGVFYIEGRVCGQLNGPGFYAVRIRRDGTDQIAVISDSKGNEVTKARLETTCGAELVAIANGCCSGPEIGEGFACIGFSCCNPLSGCITNEVCLTI